MNPLFKIIGRNKLLQYSKAPLKHQPIFIIGAPRTGSTILYQIITNQLNVLYFNNLICRIYHNTFLGFWMSKLIFKGSAHNCFKSIYGNTSKCGMIAPSECGQFWYKWLPTDKHYIDNADISEEMIDQIRDEITGLINYFDRPIVFKNLNAGQRLKLIKMCFPDAKLIFIKRNPLHTAQSILKAKRKLGIPEGTFWGIMPKNVSELKKLGAYEQIVKQIYYIEKQIVQDIQQFDSSNILIMKYTDLNYPYHEMIDSCRIFIKAEERESYHFADIEISSTIHLEEDEIKKINVQIQKMDWLTYNNK